MNYHSLTKPRSCGKPQCPTPPLLDPRFKTCPNVPYGGSPYFWESTLAVARKLAMDSWPGHASGSWEGRCSCIARGDYQSCFILEKGGIVGVLAEVLMCGQR